MATLAINFSNSQRTYGSTWEKGNPHAGLTGTGRSYKARLTLQTGTIPDNCIITQARARLYRYDEYNSHRLIVGISTSSAVGAPLGAYQYVTFGEGVGNKYFDFSQEMCQFLYANKGSALYIHIRHDGTSNNTFTQFYSETTSNGGSLTITYDTMSNVTPSTIQLSSNATGEKKPIHGYHNLSVSWGEVTNATSYILNLYKNIAENKTLLTTVEVSGSLSYNWSVTSLNDYIGSDDTIKYEVGILSKNIFFSGEESNSLGSIIFYKLKATFPALVDSFYNSSNTTKLEKINPTDESYASFETGFAFRFNKTLVTISNGLATDYAPSKVSILYMKNGLSQDKISNNDGINSYFLLTNYTINDIIKINQLVIEIPITATETAIFYSDFYTILSVEIKTSSRINFVRDTQNFGGEAALDRYIIQIKDKSINVAGAKIICGFSDSTTIILQSNTLLDLVDANYTKQYICLSTAAFRGKTLTSIIYSLIDSLGNNVYFMVGLEEFTIYQSVSITGLNTVFKSRWATVGTSVTNDCGSSIVKKAIVLTSKPAEASAGLVFRYSIYTSVGGAFSLYQTIETNSTNFNITINRDQIPGITDNLTNVSIRIDFLDTTYSIVGLSKTITVILEKLPSIQTFLATDLPLYDQYSWNTNGSRISGSATTNITISKSSSTEELITYILTLTSEGINIVAESTESNTWIFTSGGTSSKNFVFSPDLNIIKPSDVLNNPVRNLRYELQMKYDGVALLTKQYIQPDIKLINTLPLFINYGISLDNLLVDKNSLNNIIPGTTFTLTGAANEVYVACAQIDVGVPFSATLSIKLKQRPSTETSYDANTNPMIMNFDNIITDVFTSSSLYQKLLTGPTINFANETFSTTAYTLAFIEITVNIIYNGRSFQGKKSLGLDAIIPYITIPILSTQNIIYNDPILSTNSIASIVMLSDGLLKIPGGTPLTGLRRIFYFTWKDLDNSSLVKNNTVTVDYTNLDSTPANRTASNQINLISDLSADTTKIELQVRCEYRYYIDASTYSVLAISEINYKYFRTVISDFTIRRGRVGINGIPSPDTLLGFYKKDTEDLYAFSIYDDSSDTIVHLTIPEITPPVPYEVLHSGNLPNYTDLLIIDGGTW